MKLLLTGGGTAGHVNPALAIAAAWKQQDPTAEILFAASGIPTDKAADLIPRVGYELRKINIRGLRRPVYSPSNLALPFIMLRSRKEAKALIKEFKPDLIIGTGGYACWPVVSVGASMGIPTAVHESNAIPGKAIESVKKKVDLIMVNFPETIDRLGFSENDRRVLRVGNPYMSDFGNVARGAARKMLGLSEEDVYVLSFGGSLGADRVNEAVLSLWKAGKTEAPKAVFCHAAGKRDYERAKTMLSQYGLSDDPRFILKDYIYDMPIHMAAADLVISRAGAMSISELALMKKAAILIPSPFVAENHQYKNAMALHRKHAGVCIEEKDLGGGALTQTVLALLQNPDERARMGNAVYENFAAPNANETIVVALRSILKKA